jgi:hypothetical protein
MKQGRQYSLHFVSNRNLASHFETFAMDICKEQIYWLRSVARNFDQSPSRFDFHHGRAHGREKFAKFRINSPQNR